MFNSHFFKVFWPLPNSEIYPHSSLPLSPFKILYFEVENGWDFAAFWNRVSMFHWNYLGLNWVMDIITFFKLFPYFFNVFSHELEFLLTWFSPKKNSFFSCCETNDISFHYLLFLHPFFHNPVLAYPHHTQTFFTRFKYQPLPLNRLTIR